MILSLVFFCKSIISLKRREELVKKKVDEQREKREERARRVQEARIHKESQKEANLKKAKVGTGAT